MERPLPVALDRPKIPNDLEAFWMPFTPNRQFKADPRMLVDAEGMHYRTADGREILDGTAGLWCCNAGHKRAAISAAIRAQADGLDFAPAFQFGHPQAFELATRLCDLAPDPFRHAFFTNSGSEAVETALKIALAYHRARGAASRTRLIGRERAYHGVNFGGISVGGMVNNRRQFGTLLAGVDHLPHTHLPENAFSRGQPETGAHLVDDLERLVALHGADTIAAVIVEPVAGATGVLIPPVGYLERLREITARHGILLIFDEVISGFGRLGHAFAAERFGVTPDLIACAKGLTNGVIPMGAVLATDAVHAAFMEGPERAIELFHGYTYSGHPMAAAVGLATLDIYRDEDLFARARALAPYWENALHGLADARHVIDVRNLGLVGAIEVSPRPDAPGARGSEIFHQAFLRGLMVRGIGDTIALSPPLIIEESHIDALVALLGDILDAVP